MQVTVNGEAKELVDGMTIAELLELLHIQAAMLAVEHNRKILSKEEFPATKIAAGDIIEIIRFVGGG